MRGCTLKIIFSLLFIFLMWSVIGQKRPVKYIKPFIGTSNFDTINPDPIAVRDMANVSPFMVSGFQNLPLEKDSPYGIPRNDDIGTMSAWVVFSMMGINPVNPTEPMYAITKPTFKKITIHLDSEYYNGKTLEIISNASVGNNSMDKIIIDDKSNNNYFIAHDKLINAGKIEFILK